MLRRALPLRPLRHAPVPHRAPARRAFSTAPLFDPLVALLEALPSLPLIAASPYPQTTSLVLLAVALRTAALPATLWSRARQRRMVERVVPAWEEAKRTLPESVGRRCRRAGMPYEEYQAELQREVSRLGLILAWRVSRVQHPSWCIGEGEAARSGPSVGFSQASFQSS